MYAIRSYYEFGAAEFGQNLDECAGAQIVAHQKTGLHDQAMPLQGRAAAGVATIGMQHGPGFYTHHALGTSEGPDIAGGQLAIGQNAVRSQVGRVLRRSRITSYNVCYTKLLRGMGYGMGYGMGPGAYANPGTQAGQNAVRGWELMSPVERDEQMAEMHAAKTYDECTAIQTAHRGSYNFV